MSAENNGQLGDEFGHSGFWLSDDSFETDGAGPNVVESRSPTMLDNASRLLRANGFRQVVRTIVDDCSMELSTRPENGQAPGETDLYCVLDGDASLHRDSLYPGGALFPDILEAANLYSQFLFQRELGVTLIPESSEDIAFAAAALPMSIILACVTYTIRSTMCYQLEMNRIVFNINALRNLNDLNRRRGVGAPFDVIRTSNGLTPISLRIQAVAHDDLHEPVKEAQPGELRSIEELMDAPGGRTHENRGF